MKTIFLALALAFPQFSHATIYPDFYSAVCTGDVSLVQVFLNKVDDVEINSVYTSTNGAQGTPLLCAIDNGQTAVIELLLSDSRIDPNAGYMLGGSKITPIEEAYAKNNNALVLELLKKFPALDLSAFGGTRQTYIEYLIAHNSTTITCEFLAEFFTQETETSINTLDKNGNFLLSSLQTNNGFGNSPYCLEELQALPQPLDLTAKDAHGNTYRDITRGDSPDNIFYRYLNDPRAPFLYQSQTLGALYLVNHDLSIIVDPRNDHLLVYLNGDIAHPKTITLDRQWALACGYGEYEDPCLSPSEAIQKGFIYKLGTFQNANTLLIDDSIANCFLVNLDLMTTSTIPRVQCDQTTDAMQPSEAADSAAAMTATASYGSFVYTSTALPWLTLEPWGPKTYYGTLQSVTNYTFTVKDPLDQQKYTYFTGVSAPYSYNDASVPMSAYAAGNLFILNNVLIQMIAPQ